LSQIFSCYLLPELASCFVSAMLLVHNFFKWILGIYYWQIYSFMVIQPSHDLSFVFLLPSRWKQTIILFFIFNFSLDVWFVVHHANTFITCYKIHI
jgi:hypothetical protein